MSQPIFFDTASTSPCCEEAIRRMEPFARQDFGHPSSAHAYGQKAASAIRDARLFFAHTFGVEPDQVIFTSGGTEADNLAIQGIALHTLAEHSRKGHVLPLPRIVSTAVEHSAVRKTVLALQDLGFPTHFLGVNRQSQIDPEDYKNNLTASTLLLSVHQVNNITGAVFPVEELAATAKALQPHLIFHTDAVQAFGRIPVPRSGSRVDLLSLSSHKIEGPKGMGALIVLNPKLLKNPPRLRPLLYGGGQEGGFRSGTPSPGLIAGFHTAAQLALSRQKEYSEKTLKLRTHLQERLKEATLLETRVFWNSPSHSVSHIVSLSVPGCEAGPLSRLIEERGCLISTGSACNTGKTEPEPVLAAMGLPRDRQTSAIRISFSDKHTTADLDRLVEAIQGAICTMDRLK